MKTNQANKENTFVPQNDKKVVERRDTRQRTFGQDLERPTEEQTEAEWYEHAIHTYLCEVVKKGKGLVKYGYLERQPDLNRNSRSMLISWLHEVVTHYKLSDDTLFLMVNVLDRYLSKTPSVKLNQLQLIGAVSLMIASKVEDIWPPLVREMVSLGNDSFTKESFLRSERYVLKVLQYNVTVPTSINFLNRYLATTEAGPGVSSIAKYLLELTIIEYSSLQYKCSELAAGAFFLAQKLIDKKYVLPFELSKEIKMTDNKIKQVAGHLMELARKAKGRYGDLYWTIVRKYDCHKHGFASSIKV